MTAATTYERHTLLHITRAGRERVFAELAEKGYDRQVVGEMLLPEDFERAKNTGTPTPGIARREEFAPREGFIPAGFAHWQADKNGRLRIASFVLPQEVALAQSPEDVMRKAGCSRRTPALAAVIRLKEAWKNGLARFASLGLWGSAALEIATERPYTHQRSDLDVRLIFACGDRAAAETCLEAILDTEHEFGIRIDAETLLPNGYGVSLKELLQDGATVLGKGPRDVALLRKTDVFAGLAEVPA